MMKFSLKALIVIPTLLITISCDKDDTENVIPNSNTNDEPKVTVEPSKDNFKFEAGDYNISWQGSPFKTSMTLKNENQLVGDFCVNNSISNCDVIGPITITRNNNNLTFKFSDTVCRIKETNTPGEFSGNGTITSDNKYQFTVNGEDCIQKYENNIVVFSKI